MWKWKSKDIRNSTAFLHRLCSFLFKYQRVGERSLRGKTEGVRYFLLGEEVPSESPHHSSPIPKGWPQDDRGSLFTRSCIEITKGNGYKLHNKRFHLNIRNKCFTLRKIHQWNNLPKVTVQYLSLEVFNMQLDRVLDNLIYAPPPVKDWTRRSSKVPSSLGCSMILFLYYDSILVEDLWYGNQVLLIKKHLA